MISRASKAGFGRAFDIGATQRRWEKEVNPMVEDYNAIASDWRVVGIGIGESIERHKKRNHHQGK